MIRELNSKEDLRAGLEVLLELRPHLNWESFYHLYNEAKERDNYALFGYFSDGPLVSVIGMREVFDFCQGHHLYIDDLVTKEGVRSTGAGGKLMAFAEEYARERGLEGMRLCSGLQREGAHRFYERIGLPKKSYSFKKSFH